MAASWNGALAPPSRYEPAEPRALMKSLGPTTQAMRQPGRRNRLVRPSIRRTSARVSRNIARPTQSDTWGKQTVCIDVLHVRRTANGRAIAAGGVIVAAVELIQDQRRAVSADFLDLGQLAIRHKMAGRIAGIRRQDNRSAADDFLCNLIRVHMVVIILRQGDRYRRDL